MLRRPDHSGADDSPLLRVLIDSLADAAWILDRERRLVLANEPYSRLRCPGRTEGPACGDQPESLGQTPEELEAWDACYRRAFAGESFSAELTYTAAGGARLAEVAFRPVPDGGEVRYLVVTATDLTLRRQTEDAWCSVERRLAAALEGPDVGHPVGAAKAAAVGAERLRAVSDGMLDPQVLMEPIRDGAGEIVDFAFLEVNRAACAAWSRSRAEVLQTTLATVRPGAVAHSLLARCAHVADSGEPLVLDDVRGDGGLLGPGDYFDVRASRSDSAVILTWRDVTERHAAVTRERRAAEALAASEERFRSLYEAMAQGVVFQDAEGPITAANPAAERILGLSLEQLQGRRSTDPRWRAVRADGSAFPGEEHPAMLALRSGRPVHGMQMGVYHPTTDAMRWLLVDAVPQFREGGAQPWQVFTVFTDITALRAAEAALRESEDRFKYVFDRSAVGMIIRSVGGQITAVNDALCSMLGYTHEDLVGSEVGMVMFPEDAAAVRADMAEMVAGRVAEIHLCRRLRARDGAIRWGDVTFSLRRDAEGRPMYFIVAIVDVTEQVAAAAEIARLNAMRDVGERLALMGSWTFDPESGRMTWSPEVERLLDLEGPDVAGDFGALVEMRTHPEDRQRVRELFALSRREGRPPDIEHRVVHRDGSEHILHVSGALEPARAGRGARITGFVRDVTAERRAEQEAAAAAQRLAESEATLRAILENAAEGITLLDLTSGRYIFMSPRMVAMTGFTMEELNRLTREDLHARWHPDDRAVGSHELLRSAAGESAVGVVEYRWRVKSGQYRWFRESRSVLRDADGTPYALVSVSSDITARKQLEEELRESREEYRLLLEMEQAAEEEHRHIARDLHDAVAQNVFSASLIAESLPAIFEQAPERALDDVVLIRRLIRAVFAELRFLLFELRPETLAVDPMDVLLRRLADALAGKADLAVDLDVDAELVLPGDVRAVFYRVTQEAFNTIARHARATRVSVTLHRDDDTVLLEIRDNGQGCAREAGARGVGSEIMRERAESIGARLGIAGAPGAGTTVTLTWREPQPRQAPRDDLAPPSC